MAVCPRYAPCMLSPNLFQLYKQCSAPPVSSIAEYDALWLQINNMGHATVGNFKATWNQTTCLHPMSSTPSTSLHLVFFCHRKPITRNKNTPHREISPVRPQKHHTHALLSFAPHFAVAVAIPSHPGVKHSKLRACSDMNTIIVDRAPRIP